MDPMPTPAAQMVEGPRFRSGLPMGDKPWKDEPSVPGMEFVCNIAPCEHYPAGSYKLRNTKTGEESVICYSFTYIHPEGFCMVTTVGFSKDQKDSGLPDRLTYVDFLTGELDPRFHKV